MQDASGRSSPGRAGRATAVPQPLPPAGAVCTAPSLRLPASGATRYCHNGQGAPPLTMANWPRPATRALTGTTEIAGFCCALAPLRSLQTLHMCSSLSRQAWPLTRIFTQQPTCCPPSPPPGSAADSRRKWREPENRSKCSSRAAPGRRQLPRVSLQRGRAGRFPRKRAVQVGRAHRSAAKHEHSRSLIPERAERHCLPFERKEVLGGCLGGIGGRHTRRLNSAFCLTI